MVLGFGFGLGMGKGTLTGEDTDTSVDSAPRSAHPPTPAYTQERLFVVPVAHRIWQVRMRI